MDNSFRRGILDLDIDHVKESASHRQDQLLQPHPRLHIDYQGRDALLALAFRRQCGPDIPFLSPADFTALSREIPTAAAQLDTHRSTPRQREQEWDGLVKTLFEKGCNPGALWLAQQGAALGLPPGDAPPAVLELGCGAGWSTLLLYQALLARGGRSFTLVSVDQSPYAIACTAQLLARFGIPSRIKADGQLLSADLRSDLPPVLLCLDDFLSSLQTAGAQTLGAVFSDHGTAYLEPEKHAHLLAAAHRALAKGGAWVSSSLDPGLAVALSLPFIFSAMLRGGNQARFAQEPSDRRYEYRAARDGSRYLRILRDHPTALFADWMHYLFVSGRWCALRWAMGAMRGQLKTQMALRGWVRSPARSLHLQAAQGLLPGWQADTSPDVSVVPYVQTCRLVKQTAACQVIHRPLYFYF